MSGTGFYESNDPTDSRDKCTQNRRSLQHSYVYATSVPYGYLLVDVKIDQDERCRLRTNTFSGKKQYRYVYRKK